VPVLHGSKSHNIKLRQRALERGLHAERVRPEPRPTPAR
jgi:hypothetical protein